MIADLGLDTLLHDAVGRGIDAARRRDQDVLVSVIDRIEYVDPLDLFQAGSDLEDRFYWRPADGPSLFAIPSPPGPLSHAGRGGEGPAAIDRVWREMTANAVVEGPDVWATGPILTGCLPFDPASPWRGIWHDFPLGRLSLPRLLVTTHDSASWLTVNVMVRPDMEVDSLTSGILADVRRAVFGATRSNSEQEPAGRLHDCTGEHFRRVVEEAVAAIRRFELAKVVVARAAQVEGSWRAAQVLRRLREDQSHCTIFAAAHRDACFLGATPEWLVRLRDGQARISCLAGTAPRGKTEEEDVRLGQELLHSPKNLEEHAFVLTTVRESLAGVAELQVAEGPVLMKLPNLQHLSTPVTAQAVDRGVLALVERLHPTPAVAGYPRQEALDFLRAHERLDRGGYAAPLGWVDRRGQGEFAVGLRSALLRGGHATVFAGCGIVADSDPESEYAESSLKMRPMLAALGATNGS